MQLVAWVRVGVGENGSFLEEGMRPHSYNLASCPQVSKEEKVVPFSRRLLMASHSPTCR